jgi:hypothetical protein
MPGATPRRRGPWRRLRHRLRPLVNRPLYAAALALAPRIYMLYMRFVFATSRVQLGNFPELKQLADAHDGFVGLLWHEEVFTVAYGYHYAGFRPHTLANTSNAGEIITRLLQRCGFTVFRGGSGRASRRVDGVLLDMIEHMQKNSGVVYGLTVDGSKGPPYRMKSGGIVIASRCGKPLVLARTWYARCVRLRSWDRTAIPLPFNRIRYWWRGPYFAPPELTTGALEALRLRLESDLIDLAAESYAEMGQPRPANLRKP